MDRHLIESPQPGPGLLISAGVHGDEYEPVVTVHQLLQIVPELLLRGTVTLVPMVNPDAFWRGDRVADDGLDLARVCPGDPHGSVTMQAAAELSNLIQEADYYIDLHTGGTAMMVAPLAGYPLNPAEGVLDKQRQMAVAFNLPIIWGTDHRLKGRSMSIACEANVPAIYCEYEGGARCNPEGVRDYLDGCLTLMGWREMIEREQPESRVEHLVEDTRENSGHMQVCNPAPCDGLFLPAVELGEMIEAGMPLGKVTDLSGQQQETVLSQQTGILLVLRTRPNVRQGDALAVIMETPDESEVGG